MSSPGLVRAGARVSRTSTPGMSLASSRMRSASNWLNGLSALSCSARAASSARNGGASPRICTSIRWPVMTSSRKCPVSMLCGGIWTAAIYPSRLSRAVASSRISHTTAMGRCPGGTSTPASSVRMTGGSSLWSGPVKSTDVMFACTWELRSGHGSGLSALPVSTRARGGRGCSATLRRSISSRLGGSVGAGWAWAAAGPGSATRSEETIARR